MEHDADTLFRTTREQLSARTNLPLATYRVQLHAGFDFAAATAVVPYLARLGVSHLYTSPVLQAMPGSTHGYDVVDHATINAELGGAVGYHALAETVAAQG
jgi:(1->4)-alpha-D-glucan 1-alpha-D-glucosylmutase